MIASNQQLPVERADLNLEDEASEENETIEESSAHVSEGYNWKAGLGYTKYTANFGRFLRRFRRRSGTSTFYLNKRIQCMAHSLMLVLYKVTDGLFEALTSTGRFLTLIYYFGNLSWQQER